MKEIISFENVAGFDWDAGNWPKCGKHGVSREEIEYLFASGCRVLDDKKHSLTEQRFLAIGRSLSGRYVFAAFTMRDVEGQRMIRVISARYMHAEEVRKYHEEHGQAGEKDSGVQDG